MRHAFKKIIEDEFIDEEDIIAKIQYLEALTEKNQYKPREICNTLQPHAWGYKKAVNGQHKNADEVMEILHQMDSIGANLLLNVGPRPDGTLRETEVETLKKIGKWLKVNGEAIYGTRPWREFGEGTMVKISDDGKQGKSKMGPDCVRFTVKGQALYAICFGWPEFGEFTIKSLSSNNPISKRGIKSIKMLGSDEKIQCNQTESGLDIIFPTEAPCDYAYVLKIVPKGKLLFTK